MAAGLKSFGEFVAGCAICLGWILGVDWICGDPSVDNFTVWLAAVAGLAIVAIFEGITLRSLVAGLWAWGGWVIGAGILIDRDNPMGWFLVAAGLPAVGVVIGLLYRKRPARALQ
jgi:hypothetical protein